MKHKTSELEGALLDAAVALLESLHIDGIREGQCIVGVTPNRFVYAPTRKWEQGGPISERERIAPTWDDIRERWYAEVEHRALNNGVQRSYGVGPTLLVATMRAYVASKLGDTVELP